MKIGFIGKTSTNLSREKIGPPGKHIDDLKQSTNKGHPPKEISGSAHEWGCEPYQVCPSGDSGLKIVSEYDKEIPQSQTTDNPMAPRGSAAQPSRDTRKTN